MVHYFWTLILRPQRYEWFTNNGSVSTARASSVLEIIFLTWTCVISKLYFERTFSKFSIIINKFISIHKHTLFTQISTAALMVFIWNLVTTKLRIVLTMILSFDFHHNGAWVLVDLFKGGAALSKYSDAFNLVCLKSLDGTWIENPSNDSRFQEPVLHIGDFVLFLKEIIFLSKFSWF